MKKESTGDPLTGYRDFRVSLAPLEDGTPGAPETVKLDSRGVPRIDGLRPGTYVISGYPLQLVDGRGQPLQISVRSDEDLLEVELLARGP